MQVEPIFDDDPKVYEINDFAREDLAELR